MTATTAPTWRILDRVLRDLTGSTLPGWGGATVDVLDVRVVFGRVDALVMAQGASSTAAQWVQATRLNKLNGRWGPPDLSKYDPPPPPPENGGQV